MGNSTLTVTAIDVCYGQSQILGGLDLAVGSGEVVCVMGRNGVGKTTLLKAIMGLLVPRRGTITYQGRDITHLPPYQRAALGIGYAPQGREIFPGLSVQENLVLAGRRARPEAQVLEGACSLFPALSGMLRRRGGDLSGGQQQQLAIARALAGDPRLLILDEPTEGIQPSVVEEIAAVLRRFRQERGGSILLVEQYLDFARALADRFYVLDRGGVVLEGGREDFRVDEVTRLLSV